MNQTDNFIWKTEWLLGKGGFGSVFKAMNKTTGQIVAVKTFEKGEDDFRKEVDMLQSLDHENIIKLIACEKEHKMKIDVMVVEYCNGRDLGGILTDPENANGINETEFLQILHDLSAGMKYLKMNEVVHRDLKPANIMQCRKDNGKSVYKIVDFGLARKAKVDDILTTFCGTPAYMPAQDFLAMLGLMPTKRTAKFDIAILGITFYQLITNQFPFKAFDINILELKLNILKRPEDVLAVVQRQVGGPLLFMKTFHKPCLLNPSLCREMEKILKRMLVEEEKNRSNFEEYFDRVHHVLSLKPFPIFYVNRSLQTTLYCPDESSFMDALLQLVEVDASKLILMSPAGIAVELVAKKIISDFLQDVSPEKPLLVISLEENFQCLATHPSMFAEFETWCTQYADVSSVGVINDIFEGGNLFQFCDSYVAEAISKLCCAAYALMRFIEKVVVIPGHLLYVFKNLKSIPGNNAMKSVVALLILKQKLKKLLKKIEGMKLLCNGETAEKMFEDFISTADGLQTRVGDKLQYFFEYIEESEKYTMDLPSVDCNAVREKGKTFVNEMIKCWKLVQLYTDKESKTSQDKLFNILEKKNFFAAKKKLANLAKEILNISNNYYSHFNKGLSWLHKYIVNVIQDKEDMKNLNESMESFQDEVGAFKWLNLKIDELMILTGNQLQEIMKGSKEETNKNMQQKLTDLLYQLQNTLANYNFREANSLMTELETEQRNMKDLVNRIQSFIPEDFEDN